MWELFHENWSRYLPKPWRDVSFHFKIILPIDLPNRGFLHISYCCSRLQRIITTTVWLNLWILWNLHFYFCPILKQGRRYARENGGPAVQWFWRWGKWWDCIKSADDWRMQHELETRRSTRIQVGAAGDSTAGTEEDGGDVGIEKIGGKRDANGACEKFGGRGRKDVC